MKHLVVSMLLSMAACSVGVVAVKAQGKPVFPAGVPVVQVPFADDNLNFQKLGSLHMNLSMNGGEPHGFQIDTGSVGIMVGADEIPHFDGKGEPGEITYSSSGVHLMGVWTMVDVRFEDAKMPDGSPVVAHMPVLAVTRRECLGTGVNAAKCSPGPGHPHMLGIGFGRGKGDDYASLQKNAFLMLNAMQKGMMRRGYILSPRGVQLGLNAESVDAGWKWQKLEARAAKIPDSYNGPPDWETAAGTIEVDHKLLPMGTVLIDTGLTNMMMSSPGAPKDGDVPDGVPITVHLLGNQLTYSFAAGDAHDPETPRRVSWRAPHDKTFVNTGLRALSHFDYCFDDDAGYLGLKYRP
jgi:hypothetical protein